MNRLERHGGERRSCGKCKELRCASFGRDTQQWGWVGTCCLQPVIDDIRALMRTHGISAGEIQKAAALAQIQKLMDQHGIGIGELRGTAGMRKAEKGAAQAQASASQAIARRSRRTGITPLRHQAISSPPPAMGSFMAEWVRLRSGAR